MTLHYDCNLEDLAENWVEISEVWTRKEMKSLADTNEIETIRDFWYNKFTGCHIVTLDGTEIVDPRDLTLEIIEEQLDSRLCDFLGYVLMQACAHLRTLGPLSGQLLSDGVEKTAKA